jgi:hypothetical protein|tara:strand:+ start:6947 stop:8353 length:1407 start_codon:yes stop_codon:yes gene_type:complete
MKIHKQEILDGLSEKIEASASVSLDAQILIDSDLDHPSEEEIQKTLAGYGHSNPDQVDLYYINTVLVSTGWNKNDDVFAAEEAWAARDTPVDKQFNYMHDESDIIGHITGSTVIDENGTKIETEEPPEKFDIITSAVLYKSWSDPELSERMSQIVSEIEDGKWAVSMECLFSDFDYSVVSPNGDTKVVARNDESAFLTKHLRVYGGKGEYEGYKVGRLLRNIAFSGKGLVNQPANPRSIILQPEEDPFDQTFTNSINVREFNMTDDQKVESSDIEVEAAVASVNDELETIRADHEATVDGLTSTIAERDAKITELEESAVALTSEFEGTKAKLDETSTQLDEAKGTIRKMVRTAQAKDAGIADDKVKDTIAKFDTVNDEAFAAMLDLVKSQAHVSLTPSSDKPAPAAAPEPVVEEVVAEEVVEEEVEDAEVEETEAALIDAPDPVQNAFASATEFFRNSVLNTTKNLK